MKRFFAAFSIAVALVAAVGLALFFNLELLGGGPAGTGDWVTVSVLGTSMMGTIIDNLHSNDVKSEPPDGGIPDTIQIGKPMRFLPEMGAASPFVGMLVKVKRDGRDDNVAIFNMEIGRVFMESKKGVLETYIDENYRALQPLDKISLSRPSSTR